MGNFDDRIDYYESRIAKIKQTISAAGWDLDHDIRQHQKGSWEYEHLVNVKNSLNVAWTAICATEKVANSV